MPHWAARLLEQFEAGKFTDCIIRVSFPEAAGRAGPSSSSSSAAVAPTAAVGKGKARRPSKKAKTSETAEAASSTDIGTGRTEDIPCHAVILSSRSPYFDSALSRGWSEGEKKVVEIALADEAAVDDLKLLLRLSYGESYVKHAYIYLDRATRLRLAELADALEFTDAVGECLKSLGDGLTLKSAITCLDEIPEQLREHSAVFELRTDMQTTLVSGMDDLVFDIKMRRSNGECAEAELELLSTAGAALAKMVGPVEKLFQFKEAFDERGLNYYRLFSLPDDILAMPSEVLRVLLESDALQVKCEDETYYFLVAYLLNKTPSFASGHEQFNFLRSVYDTLRFQHFRLDFVWNVLNHCPLLRNNCSDLPSEIMRLALSRHHAQAGLLRQEGLTPSPEDRGLKASTGMQPTWTFEKCFYVSLQHRLDRGHEVRLHVWMVGGLPLKLSLKHLPTGKCGLYFSVIFPDPPRQYKLKDRRGVGMRIVLEVDESPSESIVAFFLDGEAHGSTTCLDQEYWQDKRKGDTLYFPIGQVKVTASFLNTG